MLVIGVTEIIWDFEIKSTPLYTIVSRLMNVAEWVCARMAVLQTILMKF